VDLLQVVTHAMASKKCRLTGVGAAGIPARGQRRKAESRVPTRAQTLQVWTGHRLGGKLPGVLFTPLTKLHR
jgi:hypothetical protein